MALTVGELVAYIRADGTQFDRQVDQSGSKFQALGGIVSAGTKAIATTFAAVTTASVGLVASVAKIGADYNRLQQSSRAALTTLLGSAEAANAQMDKLDAFAKNSPFAKQVFITAQQQLLGFGVAADRVLPTLDAIQNAVAAVGGSNDQVSQVTYALAQMQGQGKLTGETLNQLGQYGIDAATILGEKLGQTGQEIRDLASKPGGIPVAQVWDPLVTGLMDRFGGATAGIKLQMDGAVDRIKGAWRDIGSVLAAPFIDPQGGGRAVEWANKVADALRALEAKARPLVDILVDRFTPALNRVTPTLDKIRVAINAWDLSKVNSQLDTLGKYAPLVAGTSAAVFALGTRNLPILQTLGITGLNPVVAGIGALVAASPALRQAGGDFLNALSPLLPLVAQLGVVFADTAMEVGGTLTPAVSDLLQVLAPLIVTVAQQLTPSFVGVIQAAGPVAEVLADVVGWITDPPTPVLAAAAAFVLLRSPLSGVIMSLGDGLTSALGAVRESLAASHGVAEAMGTQVGFVGAASLSARAGVASLGGVLKSAFMVNPVGIAIAAISTGLGLFISAQQEARQRTQEFRPSLDETTGAMTTNTRALALNNLEVKKFVNGSRSAADMAENLGISMRDLVDAVLDPTSEAAGRLARDFESMKVMFAADSSNRELGLLLEEYAAVLGEVGIVTGSVEEAQRSYAREVEAGATATHVATDATDGLTAATWDNVTATRDAALAELGLMEARIRSEDAVARFHGALERFAEVNEDVNSTEADKAQALRDVEAALLDTVTGYSTMRERMEETGATMWEVNRTLTAQRDEFIANAIEMGYTEEAAKAFADQIGLTPREWTTQFAIDSMEAEGNLYTWQNTIAATPREWTTRFTTVIDGGVPTYRQGTGAWAYQARGGMWDGKVKTFAGSGINAAGRPVPRIPQVAKGGDNILWAEPETSWEAYISGMPSARQRSLAVLDEAARRLGVIVIPQGVTQYADGAMRASAPTTTQPTGDRAPLIGQLTAVGYDPDDAVRQFGNELQAALWAVANGSAHTRSP